MMDFNYVHRPDDAVAEQGRVVGGGAASAHYARTAPGRTLGQELVGGIRRCSEGHGRASKGLPA